MKHYNCTVTHEEETDNKLLVFEIEGNLTPYVPARTYGPPEDCYPAEGGQLEEYQVTLIGGTEYDEDGNIIRSFEDFTDEERVAEAKIFTERLDDGGHLFEEIQQMMFDDAAEASYDYED